MVKSTNGIEYDMDECKKVIKKYTPQEVEKLKDLQNQLTDLEGEWLVKNPHEYLKIKKQIRTL